MTRFNPRISNINTAGFGAAAQSQQQNNARRQQLAELLLQLGQREQESRREAELTREEIEQRRELGKGKQDIDREGLDVQREEFDVRKDIVETTEEGETKRLDTELTAKGEEGEKERDFTAEQNEADRELRRNIQEDLKEFREKGLSNEEARIEIAKRNSKIDEDRFNREYALAVAQLNAEQEDADARIGLEERRVSLLEGEAERERSRVNPDLRADAFNISADAEDVEGEIAGLSRLLNTVADSEADKKFIQDLLRQRVNFSLPEDPTIKQVQALRKALNQPALDTNLLAGQFEPKTFGQALGKGTERFIEPLFGLGQVLLGDLDGAKERFDEVELTPQELVSTAAQAPRSPVGIGRDRLLDLLLRQ